jgi:hypothetical protein
MSAAMVAANSFGVLPSGSNPSPARRSTNFGSLTARHAVIEAPSGPGKNLRAGTRAYRPVRSDFLQVAARRPFG